MNCLRAILLFLFTWIVLSSEGFTASLSLKSDAFDPNKNIPTVYTCDGDDHSPSLKWQNDFSNTKSYALLVDDPDAPGGLWNHWVLFNIPANTSALSEGKEQPPGSIHGKNSWGLPGYRGPCPPSGTHRYVFKLYALDDHLNLDDSANEQDVLNAMKNHIIAQDELVGLYSKH